MEKDNDVKNLLAKGAEFASPHFTVNIMKKISDLSSKPALSYQPLVSIKIVKAFITAFVLVVTMIFLLCLMISTPELPLISSKEIPQIIFISANKILFFILSFWLVFYLNNALQKRSLAKFI